MRQPCLQLHQHSSVGGWYFHNSLAGDGTAAVVADIVVDTGHSGLIVLREEGVSMEGKARKQGGCGEV